MEEVVKITYTSIQIDTTFPGISIPYSDTPSLYPELLFPFISCNYEEIHNSSAKQNVSEIKNKPSSNNYRALQHNFFTIITSLLLQSIPLPPGNAIPRIGLKDCISQSSELKFCQNIKMPSGQKRSTPEEKLGKTRKTPVKEWQKI